MPHRADICASVILEIEMIISALKLETLPDDVAALIENGMNFLDKA